jgi:hypothetical protein
MLAVFVHGDRHPYNQLWDPRELRLLLVADFETSEFDESSHELLVRCLARAGQLGRRAIRPMCARCCSVASLVARLILGCAGRLSRASSDRRPRVIERPRSVSFEPV